MKVAAVVILFNPDETAFDNISSYCHHVEKVFVFDNTEKHLESMMINIEKIQNLPNVLYYSDMENKGISQRLNQAADLALNSGFDWLLTMDQDSQFGANNFQKYLECVSRFPEADEVGMFGILPNIEPSGTECNFKTVEMLITSGSLLNLAAFQAVGEFDENLFIDYVDYDYSFRLKLANFTLVQFQNIKMIHGFGTIVKGFSIKTFKRVPQQVHPPIRLYYMCRNYFYIQKKFDGHFKRELRQMRLDLISRIKNNLILGSNRRMTLKLVVKGYSDFTCKKFGKKLF